MQCPKCQHENREGRKFCAKCGEKMGWLCPKCGFENEADELFCGECGTKHTDATIVTTTSIPKLEDMHSQLQSMIPESLAQKYLIAEEQDTRENRPITALFADISGFTPLSNTKSSEDMFQLVQDCFKQLVNIVAKYEGSISGFRGDGLLALFGAPILHENDAERAILAGIEMRDMMHGRGLGVSIGINTAMMTVGDIQTQLHKEYTAYGTDVNLAARLQQFANPGQILVGAGTHRLTRRAFDFEIISDISLKGFPQTVTAYSVQQAKAHPEKLRGIEGLRARMIGREHEFTEVKETVDEWLSGHGQIVSVIGEAGIGKSRLVSEMRKGLETRDMRHENKDFTQVSSPKSHVCLEGRCVSIGQPISYWPFIDILRTYFNLKEDDDPSTIAQKVTDGTKHVFPNTSDETLPFIGRLLSVRFGNELDDRLKFTTPEQIRHQTLMQLRDFFRELANKQPLLLILEDLHWSDEVSIDLITYLLDELSHAPLMLLCVYRPEKEQKVWKLSEQAQRKCLDRYTEITLKRLSSHEGRLLVEELLTIDDLPDSVKNIILEKSEGNPFFIEEVIRSLIEQDMVYRDADRWRARSEIININVPDTIQSVLLSRVDRLQSEARYVLQCASVIGRLFKYSLLDHLTSQEHDLNRCLSELEDRELVYEERRIPELEYAFKHALTQEATYQNILENKRKEFHNQVAQGIERLYHERLEEYYEQLAYHYDKGGVVEKAVEYLLLAGEKATSASAPKEALSFYDRVLTVADLSKLPLTTDQELRLHGGRGKVYFLTNEWAKSIESYQQMLEVAQRGEDKVQEGEALYQIAYAQYWGHQFEDALECAERAYRLAVETDSKAALAGSLIITSSIYMVTGKAGKARAGVQEALSAAEASGIPFLKSLALTISGQLQHFQDNNSAALDFFARAMKIARDEQILPVLSIKIFAEALANCNSGNYDRAIAGLKEGMELCDRLGERIFRCRILNSFGWVYIDLCNWDLAIQYNTQGAVESREVGEPEIICNAEINLADCYLALDNLDEAQRLLESVHQESQELSSSGKEWMKWRYTQHLHHSLGELWLARGDAEKAISFAEECLAVAVDTNSRRNIVKGRRLKGEAFIVQGRFAEAEMELTEALRVAHEVGNPAQLWKTYAILGHLRRAQGQPQEALAAYHDAISVIEGVAAQLSDASLRETLLSSPQVATFRELVREDEGK